MFASPVMSDGAEIAEGDAVGAAVVTVEGVVTMGDAVGGLP